MKQGKWIVALLLCAAMLVGFAFASASGEASGSASAGGGGGALPSGGSFGDVKTGVVKNAVVLAEAGQLTVDEGAADVYELAACGELTAERVSGLHLENASVYNRANADGAVTQGVSGVVFVDTDGLLGGAEDFYTVDEGGDPMARPSVRAAGADGAESSSGEASGASGESSAEPAPAYNSVLILDDEDDAFRRSAGEIAMGAALAVGGGTEENVLTVDNCYLWTSGFKRTALFADDRAVQLVVRASRIVCPGADNYKLGWQALYGGSRCTLLQNGDCWFYNDEIVTEGWGGLAIDSSPNLDLYAVNSSVDVLGGGYVSYTPGDGSVNFFGVKGDSAQYGVFVTGNSKSYLHSMDDLTDEAKAHMTDGDAAAPSVTDDGRTVLRADYAAYLTHQGGGNSPTTEAYLFAENSLLSTWNTYTIHDKSHFLNDSYGGTSWFWTEFWRGSTCLCRSTNATFEFDNVTLESRTGVVFRTVVNWEGGAKSFALDAGTDAVGNTLILRNMDVTGDVRNDDVYRNLAVDMTDTTLTGAFVSTTVDDWNALWTVEALEASPACAAAREEIASWADGCPNPTYDAEYPYADFALDLDAVSANLTQPAYDAVNGVRLTLNDGAVWNVAGDSSLVRLVVGEGAAVNAPGCDIYVDCNGLRAENGRAVDALPAGEYENVVLVYHAPSTVLKGAMLLDATHNGEVLDVLVRDGTIAEIGKDLDGDVVVDLTGCTLMPGLIDAHVHVADSAGYNLALLSRWCEQGVTAVRELGMLSTQNEEDYLPLIRRANADPANATLVSCGKYLDVAGGYGMGPTGTMGVEITNADEAAAEVAHKAALGYPQVKVGVNSDEYRMSGEELLAVVGAAHENGMPVSAHINSAKYLEELVGYGIDEAAHTPQDAMSDTLIAAMVENGVSMNSSGAEAYEEIKIANLRAFYEAGGLITVGTDKMRGYDTAMESLLSEMAVLAKAGLSVQEVVACATHNAAAVLGLNAGDVAVGLSADLIAVPGALDASFEALTDVSFVMNDGVIVVG